jgi:chorismate--pyruvate lyase
MTYTQPHWQPSLHTCPSLWRGWLQDQGSLTRQLQRKSEGNFRVQLLRQGWARPRPDEARALGIKGGRVAMVREVMLQGCGQDWVYARSVMPMSSIKGRMRCLRRLGNRPLGEWLFRHPATRRGPILICKWPPTLLPPELSYLPRLRPWARYSLFTLVSARLLVSEVFLPALTEKLPLE